MSIPNGLHKETKVSSSKVKEWEKIGCLCPDHLGEVVSFFCEDCIKAACTLCSMNDHYKHSKKFVGDKKVNEGSFGHTGIFFPPEFTIDGILIKLNEDLQDIDLRSEDSQEAIKSCISTYKDVLEAKKKMLIDHVNAVKKAKIKFLQEQQKQLRKTLDELVSSSSYAARYLESDDHFSLLSAEKEITKRLAELNEKCSKITLPTQKDWNLDKIKMIRDGKYTKINRFKQPPSPPTPGMKTIHDSGFRVTSASLSFNVEPEVFQAFVRTCCQELGEKYWLRVT